MALLMLGLQPGAANHLSKIVRQWPLSAKLPSLVTRLNRFVKHEKLRPWAGYAPLAKALVTIFAGGDLRLIIDVTKVGFNRLLSVSIAYKKRS